MDNVIDFQSAKAKRKPKIDLLEEFDLQFVTLSSKKQKELLTKLKSHFSTLGIKFVFGSKLVSHSWIKKFSPLLNLDKKIGFSFAVKKAEELEGGWTMHPISVNCSDDYSLAVNEILRVIQSNGGKNE